MEHPDFADHFQNTVDAVIEEYRDAYRRKLDVDNPNLIGRKAETDDPLTTHPAIDGFIGRHFVDIEQMGAFETTCQYAISNFEIVEQYHSKGEELQYGIENVLLQFIKDVLGHRGWEFDYSESEFETIYSEYEEDLLSETVPERTFVCLQGLQLEDEFERAELDDNIEIRRINERDRQIVTNSRSPESMLVTKDKQFRQVNGPKIDYVLEVRFDVEKEDRLSDDFPDYVSERSWSIYNALTALRLVKETEVTNYGRKYTEHMAAWESGLGGGGGISNQVAWLAKYHLQKQDVENLRQTFELLQSKDFESIDKDVKMAIDRFNSANLRSDWRIEFSDMIIILEALLSKGSEISRQELAQKTAILLGESHEERKDIYKDIRDLYDQRSRIWGVAHGGGRKKLENHEDILNPARNYAAQALLRVLEIERDVGGLGNLLKRMNNNIDEAMLDVEFL